MQPLFPKKESPVSRAQKGDLETFARAFPENIDCMAGETHGLSELFTLTAVTDTLWKSA
jgi:hypothetical protein